MPTIFQNGVNTLAQLQSEPIATDVRFVGDMICVTLADGREVRTPLEFYPNLASAKEEELRDYRFIGDGRGIHWEKLDEDLSVESIILGRKAYNCKSDKT